MKYKKANTKMRHIKNTRIGSTKCYPFIWGIECLQKKASKNNANIVER